MALTTPQQQPAKNIGSGKAILRPLRLNPPELLLERDTSYGTPQDENFNSATVRLDVSGAIFLVFRSTLTRRDPKSLFNEQLRAIDPKRTHTMVDLHIHRPHVHFMGVINYLRTGKLYAYTKEASELDALLKEARFYRCVGLETLVLQRLHTLVPYPPRISATPTPPTAQSCRHEVPRVSPARRHLGEDMFFEMDL